MSTPTPTAEGKAFGDRVRAALESAEMITTPIIEDLRARLAGQDDRIGWLEQQREIAVSELERRTREVIGEEFIELQTRLESEVGTLRKALALAESELKFWLSHARAAEMYDSGRDTLAVLQKVHTVLHDRGTDTTSLADERALHEAGIKVARVSAAGRAAAEGSADENRGTKKGEAPNAKLTDAGPRTPDVW